MAFFFQELVNGITTGALYALVALGFTMVYGVLQLLNFAHGDLYMVGAYIGFFVIQWFGGPSHLTIAVPLLLVIMFVLAGGLVGGILGPSISRVTIDILEPKFTGAYLALIVFVLVTIAILSRIRVPDLSAAEQASSGRPLSEIARQPKYIVAVLSGAISYGVMNFLMTSTPIAMQICGHPYSDATFVISSHVVGMFAPSFVTGFLIRRFGVLRVMLTGATLNLVTIGIALSGVSVANFWWSLVLLGVGWNFLYIGGTTLLTETYRPEERAKAQGANDQAIFIMMAVSSFSSGLTVTTAGWERVNLFALPLIATVAVALVWFGLRERRRAAA